MKTGVNVTHLICETGEVIKDERRSASAWIKKTKKTPQKQAPPDGFDLLSAVLSDISLPASLPGPTVSDGATHNKRPAQLRRTMMLARLAAAANLAAN